MRPERRLGGGRGIAVPQVVDQLIARHDPAGVEHENREHRTLFAATQADRSAVVDDLKRTEDAEIHAYMVRKLQGTCNAISRVTRACDSARARQRRTARFRGASRAGGPTEGPGRRRPARAVRLRGTRAATA